MIIKRIIRTYPLIAERRQVRSPQKKNNLRRFVNCTGDDYSLIKPGRISGLDNVIS